MADLKKQDMLAGLIIEIRSDRPLKNGLASVSPLLPRGASAVGWSSDIPSVGVHSFDKPGKSDFNLSPGETCEIIRGPRKIEGMNVIEIRNNNGDEGYVFWCEFKVNGVSAPNSAPPAPSRPKP